MTAGIIGRLAGRLVFGVLVKMMDMIPMPAMLIDNASMAVGWLVQLATSAFIGDNFAVLLPGLAISTGRASLLGLGYGVVWLVLGSRLVMPWKLGITT